MQTYNRNLKTLFERINAAMYPFQYRWVYEDSKWTAALKPRQVGFTTYSLLRVAIHGIKNPGHQWYIVARTRKNAIKLLGLLKNKWLRAFAATGIPQLQIVNPKATTEITLANGTTFTALANDPDSMRGLEGSYLFDEIAFWPKRLLVNLRGAVWPTIDNEFNPDCILMAISTPWFAEGLYWEIFHRMELHPQFSRHVFNIYDAMNDGYPFDVNAVKARTPGDIFAREYLNDFWKTGASYFGRDALLQALPLTLAEPRRSLGVDLAKISDLTSIVGTEFTSHAWNADRVWLMRSLDYSKQEDVILDVAREYDADIIGVDITKHASFADTLRARLERRHREDGQRLIPIVGRDFTNQWKVEETQGLLRDLENGVVGIDFDDVVYYDNDNEVWTAWPARQLLDDLGLVKQGTTGNNKLKFFVDRKDAKEQGTVGHGDSYSGLLIARYLNRVIDLYVNKPIVETVKMETTMTDSYQWTPEDW